MILKQNMKHFFFCLMMLVGLNCYGAATSKDWETCPMPEENVYIPLGLAFSKAEFDEIREGFIPQAMEDKWFVVVEGSHIFLHRSWTGRMIYDCIFEEREGDVLVIGFYANRDVKQYLNKNDEQDVRSVQRMLRELATRCFG